MITGDPVPHYKISASELNDIHRLDVEIITRSRNEDPNPEYLNSGTYLAGSAATRGAVAEGVPAPYRYSDRYRRATFKAVTSLRNLVVTPGELSMAANPLTLVGCPDNTSTITATVLDGDGVGADNTTVTFNTSEGTLDPVSVATTGTGDATTVLTYEWEQPSVTATVSASAPIDGRLVLNAIPISFGWDTTGTFTDNFDDGNSHGWTEEGTGNWNVVDGQYKVASGPGSSARLNGCAALQNYEAQVDIQVDSLSTRRKYVGLFVRYQSPDQYYSATLHHCWTCTSDPNNNNTHTLKLRKYDSGNLSLLSKIDIAPTFDQGAFYTLKTSVNGDDFKVKFWKTGDPEPDDWEIEATDTSYTSGKIALATKQIQATFDKVAVNPVR